MVVVSKFSIFTHLSAGKHRMQITAKDRAGNTSSYREMELVHSEGDMPIPPMIDPIPNPINENIITVEGNAYAGFYVELYRNNELMGSLTVNSRGRFRFENVSLVPGRNILKVRQREQWVAIDLYTPSQLVRTAESPEVIVDVISGMPVRSDVKIDFPINGAVTNSEFLPLRGIVNNPNATIRINGYYSPTDGPAANLNGWFVGMQKIPLLPGANTLWVEASLPDGTKGVDKITVYSKRDAAVPQVKIASPAGNETVYDRYIPVTGSTESAVQRVIINETEALLNNGNFISDMADVMSGYTQNPEGYQSMITAWAMDGNGRIGHYDVRVGYRYLSAPQLYITSPVDGEVLSASPVTVRGEAYDATEVRVNGLRVHITGNTFSAEVGLNEGQNVITILARNAGKAVVQTVAVTCQPSSPVTLQSIAILPSPSAGETLRIALGETIQLRAIGTYSNGTQLDLTVGAVWTSSNPAIAAVNRGLVTSRSMGLATITANYGGINTSTTLYIGLPELIEIRIYLIMVTDTGRGTLEPPAAYAGAPSSTRGEKALYFMAIGVYSDGVKRDISYGNCPTPFTCQQTIWTSSNPAVAAISPSGDVKALSKGTTEITATMGSMSASRTFTVLPTVWVFITSPVDGSTINRPEVMVTGRVLGTLGAGTADTGVIINGIPATVIGVERRIDQPSYSNWFVANNVPLSEGQNTITAVATDTEGNTDKNSITVNAVTTGSYISLTANPESGLSPLEAVLKIDGTFSIQASSISYSGPGGVEWLSSTQEEYRVRLTAEGIHTFTANVLGPDGNTIYQDTAIIVVQNRDQLDGLLKKKWDEMKAALMRVDIEGAVGYFVAGSRDKYRQIFTQLGSDKINSIFSNISEIRLYTAYGQVAECGAIRSEAGKAYSYPVTFVKDENGIWRIIGF